jgi:hypothetical protein
MVTRPQPAANREHEGAGIALVRDGRGDRVVYLEFGSDADCTQKARERQKLECELVPQVRAPVCGDHRENFGGSRFRFIAVDRSDATIGEVVHEGKESGGWFARRMTLYWPIPRPTRRRPQRLEQPLVRKAAAA